MLAQAFNWFTGGTPVISPEERIRLLGEECALLRSERDAAVAELARWKPVRDSKGHFIKAGTEAQKVRA